MKQASSYRWSQKACFWSFCYLQTHQRSWIVKRSDFRSVRNYFSSFLDQHLFKRMRNDEKLVLKKCWYRVSLNMTRNILAIGLHIR